MSTLKWIENGMGQLLLLVQIIYILYFNKQIDTIIKRLKEGLKLNITVPYMICK